MEEFSTEAVRQFIKFLYGMELEEEWTDLEFIKELIVLGGVYSVSDLQTAAAPYLAVHLNDVNSAELREFSAVHNAAVAGDLCQRVLDYEEVEEPYGVLVPLLGFYLICALYIFEYCYEI